MASNLLGVERDWYLYAGFGFAQPARIFVKC
jgi:hypothetical protein